MLQVLEAIRRVRPSDVSTYPSCRDAVIATAAHFGVDPDSVLLTNGLDEGILMAAVGHIARKRVHDAETIMLPRVRSVSQFHGGRRSDGHARASGPQLRVSDAAGHRRGDATNAHDFPEHAEQPDRAVDPNR